MDEVLTTAAKVPKPAGYNLNKTIVEMIRDYTHIKPHLKSMLQDYIRLKPYFEWLEAGRPLPPPPVVKQITIKEYANKGKPKHKPKVFVETGTFLGDTVYAMKDVFEKIYSVELGYELYERAKVRFAQYSHVSILHGDSAAVIGEILGQVNERCLFWLDAHYSGGVTAKGEFEPPTRLELEHIFNHPVKNHVILIDDARGLPVSELRNFVSSRRPDYTFEVRDDMVRICNGSDEY